MCNLLVCNDAGGEAEVAGGPEGMAGGAAPKGNWKVRDIMCSDGSTISACAYMLVFEAP